MLYFYSCLVRIGEKFRCYSGSVQTLSRIATCEELADVQQAICDDAIIPYLKKEYPGYTFTAENDITFIAFNPM